MEPSLSDMLLAGVLLLVVGAASIAVAWSDGREEFRRKYAQEMERCGN